MNRRDFIKGSGLFVLFPFTTIKKKIIEKKDEVVSIDITSTFEMEQCCDLGQISLYEKYLKEQKPKTELTINYKSGKIITYNVEDIIWIVNGEPDKEAEPICQIKGRSSRRVYYSITHFVHKGNKFTVYVEDEVTKEKIECRMLLGKVIGEND